MAERSDNLLNTINLPYNTEAEQAVLGAIITDATVLPVVMETIRQPEEFYSSANQTIYQGMVTLFMASKPLDFVTIFDYVSDAGAFENDEETKVYLYNLTQTVPTIKNVGSYAKIVHDKYILRSLIRASESIADMAQNTPESADLVLDAAEQKIYDIRNGNETGALKAITPVIYETLEHLQLVSGPDRDKYLGLETGFAHLDKTLTGLNGSDLIILAARPGVGKTSLALNIASNVATKYKDKAVAIFSLEMSNMQLAERLLSSDSGVSSMAFRTGEVGSGDWANIAQSASRFSNTRIYLDDTSGITVGEIKAKTRRIPNLGLIIVDYLQLMSSGNSNDSRVNIISEMTRNFKIMAKDLNVPVLLLSQLSRSNEKQARRPMLSDLRDSGSIEQDADIVMFLHREIPENAEYTDPSQISEITLIVAKNRHGEVRNISLHWDGAHTKFTSMDYRTDE